MVNPISKNVNQILLGSLIGDATINRANGSPRIHFSHCIAQESYNYWKYEQLSKDDLVVSPPKIVMSGKDKKYPQSRFQTKQSRIFDYYVDLFYPSGKKKLQRRVLNMLEPLGLAVWFMDDGNTIIHKYKKKDGTQGVKSREIAINTQCFSYEEHEIIQQYFGVQWEVEVRINKNKNSYRIVMNATNAKKFFQIIEPYVLPSMRYKIDLQYS